MLELRDATPTFEVPDGEYFRLLGFPRGYEAAGRVRELAAGARAWYRAHGTPWWYARQVERLDRHAGGISIDGAPFASEALRAVLDAAGADSAVLVAVSAGSACEEHAGRLWAAGKPDEYFFLEVYGSAVVEALVAAVSYRLCAWAEQAGLAVVPHHSPGYPGWEITDQQRLLDRIATGPGWVDGARLRVLESGMLRPKKSLLAVFGVTAAVDRVRGATPLSPCDRCALGGCRYRRTAYRHPLPRIEAVRAAPTLTPDVPYRLGRTALEKWARERLRIRSLPDGSREMRFRFDGSTCSNLGRPLAFDYRVLLSSPVGGYRIVEARCGPAPDDEGHTAMCEYLADAAAITDAIATPPPSLGRPLEDALRRPPEAYPSGCWCDAAARAHKWGMVLEVIHFALAQAERADATDDPPRHP